LHSCQDGNPFIYLQIQNTAHVSIYHIIENMFKFYKRTDNNIIITGKNLNVLLNINDKNEFSKYKYLGQMGRFDINYDTSQSDVSIWGFLGMASYSVPLHNCLESEK
jgi:hypothetical protein